MKVILSIFLLIPMVLFSQQGSTEANVATAKESAFSGKRILGLSPALISAAAAIAFGVWIGGRLTMDIPTNPVNTSESREGMLSAVAEDLHLIDISESALETYLMDNQNPEQP